MQETELNKKLKHIEKVGGRLLRLMNAALVFFLIASVCNLTMAVGSLFAEKLPQNLVKKIYDDTKFSVGGTIIDLNEESFIEAIGKYRVAGIGFLLMGLYAVLVVIILYNYRKVIYSVVNGSQPFTEEAGLMMKKYSNLTLFFILSSNPVVGVILFIMLRLFAVLVEYGAYLQKKADETNRIQEEIIVSFAEITENKSGQTGQHIRRVAEYSKIIAKELGMTDEQVQLIGLASTMHDVGKLIVPSEILDKPGRLTDEEFTTIKTHTTYGAALLSRVEGDVMQLSRTIALEHHERVDGKGYPLGKEGRAISPESRIVAVADVYDALTSKRSYKKAWDPKEAFDEIVKNAGSQFDINVIEAFKAAYDKIEETRQRYADKDTVEEDEL